MAMIRINAAFVLGIAVLALVPAAQAQAPGEVFVYRQVCDASAGVALDADHFVVADDERNALQIYRRGRPQPVETVKLWKFLGTGKDKESDIEGAAAIGSRIYWISSHGRNSRGEVQPRRYRFFATDVRAGSPPRVEAVGSPYVKLLDDLLAEPALSNLNLAAAADLAPEAPGGLNIEGLAARGDDGLLIGFRNPRPGGRALLIPLDNPTRLLKGKRARFGAPVLLDLGGKGIRSIERVGDSYLIVAGPSDDDGAFALYRWSGNSADAPGLLTGVDLQDLRPEGLFAIPETNDVQLLSDDGGIMVDGAACKSLDIEERRFRSIIVRP